MTDLETQQEYPEARQLYHSLLSYMDSSRVLASDDINARPIDRVIHASSRRFED